MAGYAQSFLVTTDAPERVAVELQAAVARLARPGGALVFVAGRLAEQLPAVAEALAQLTPPVPLLIAPGAGVLTEQGEIEGQSAAAGVCWSSAPAEVAAVAGRESGDVADALLTVLSDRVSRRELPAFVALASDVASDLDLTESRGLGSVFGAGTVGPSLPAVVDAQGTLSFGRAATLVFHGLNRPSVATSPACRLITPLLEVTEETGRMLLSLGGRPALEVLSQAAESLDERSLVLVALSPDGSDEAHPSLLVRPIHGVDPARQSVVLTGTVPPGHRVAFAVRDSGAARADLTQRARRTRLGLAGAAPRFGVYLTCAGRGAGLYGASGVDSSILRDAFPELPFAGMYSSFELSAPSAEPQVQLYSGVLSVFSAPS